MTRTFKDDSTFKSNLTNDVWKLKYLNPSLPVCLFASISEEVTKIDNQDLRINKTCI